MKKPKRLVISDLKPEYLKVFDAVAEGLDLSRSDFLISLMVQNGVIQGGLERVISDPDHQSEWVENLIARQFAWANSL